MDLVTISLAIYGAVLSSLVAGFQIYKFRMESKFIVVDMRRGTNLTSESIHFRISNRAAKPTQIQEIMISGFGAGNKGGFHSIWGSGVAFYKLARIGDDIDERVELDLPYVLQPGESTWVNFTSEECARQIEYFTTPPYGEPNFQQSDLFELEISHSQKTSPFRVNFEVERQYLQTPMTRWRKMVPYWKRRPFRPFSSPHR